MRSNSPALEGDDFDEEEVTAGAVAAMRPITLAQVALRRLVHEQGVDAIARRTGLSRACLLKLRQGTARNPELSTITACMRIGIAFECWITTVNGDPVT